MQGAHYGDFSRTFRGWSRIQVPQFFLSLIGLGWFFGDLDCTSVTTYQVHRLHSPEPYSDSQYV